MSRRVAISVAADGAQSEAACQRQELSGSIWIAFGSMFGRANGLHAVWPLAIIDTAFARPTILRWLGRFFF